MTYFRRIFATAIIFLSTSVWCDSGSQRDRFGRSNLVVPVGENEPLLARRYEAASALRGSPASNRRGLGGNSLFGSWIGTRELMCPEAGMFVCAVNPSNCCPDGYGCCADNDSCLEAGAACCGSYACPVGWGCCTDGTCYPKGGECCTTGYYCPPGTTCVLADGVQKCVAVGGVSPPTTIAAPPTTTAPPAALFEYYYYTITWWYVEWYYTWNHIAEKVDETVLASTTTTLYTTVSIYESNSAAAVASFQSLSATLSLPTPAVRTNSVVSGTPLSVQSSTTNAQVAPTTALATATKASANAIAAGWASSYAIVVFTGLFITPCFLMILL